MKKTKVEKMLAICIRINKLTPKQKDFLVRCLLCCEMGNKKAHTWLNIADDLREQPK